MHTEVQSDVVGSPWLWLIQTLYNDLAQLVCCNVVTWLEQHQDWLSWGLQ